MKIANFDLTIAPLVVAEIGNNHEGDYCLAVEMIHQAADCGVGAVKFQTFQTAQYISPEQTERFRRLQSFELSQDQFSRLRELAKQLGLLFISTPFDLASARFLAPLVDAIKIASADNVFYPLLEEVAASDKPVIMSTGLANNRQIRYSQALVRKIWDQRQLIEPPLVLLHCVCGYPVPRDQTNLATIFELQQVFPDCLIGYSDHSLGIEAAALSVALGAKIVEKHFTVDKNYSDFRDHQLSADPQEMKQLVQKIAEITVLLGDRHREVQPCELEMRSAVHRSIAAAGDFPAGKTLTSADLVWTRPAGGFPPGSEKNVLGKRLLRPVNRGQMLHPEMLG